MNGAAHQVSPLPSGHSWCRLKPSPVLPSHLKAINRCQVSADQVLNQPCWDVDWGFCFILQSRSPHLWKWLKKRGKCATFGFLLSQFSSFVFFPLISLSSEANVCNEGNKVKGWRLFPSPVFLGWLCKSSPPTSWLKKNSNYFFI